MRTPFALLMIPVAVAAQRPRCPRSPGDTTVLTTAQAERPPVALEGNRSPNYPALLWQAGIGGVVRVTFVVDTTGRPERRSIAVVRSPNAGFNEAVRSTVASWRYAPARFCGQAARGQLAHEFVFAPPPADSLRTVGLFDSDSTTRATLDTLSDGTPRWSIGGPPPGATPPPAWIPSVLDSAEDAVLAHLVEEIGPDTTGLARIVCLAGDSGATGPDPKARRLVRLMRPGIAVLPARRCPRTFASMIYTPGVRPDPPGDDPHEIVVRGRSPVAPTRAVFAVDVSYGNGGHNYRCGAERVAAVKGWRVRCSVTGSWVH